MAPSLIVAPATHKIPPLARRVSAPGIQRGESQRGIVIAVTFVLIHGAGGNPWYWHLVDAELRQRGHDVVVVDLPTEDDTAGLPEYTEAVIGAIGDRTDLVLVAQSMAGFTAPLVCERLPVSLLVLVNAMVPRAGETPGDWWANTGQPEAQREKDLQEGRPVDAEFDPFTMFFHDMPQEILDQVGPQERRQSGTPFQQAWPLTDWPDVPTRLLTGRDDRLFPAEFQRRVALARLGLTPEEMSGGHLVALSHPQELADRLEAAAAEKATATRRRRRQARTRRAARAREPIEEVVADLDRLVSALINENRELRRHVERLRRQAVDALPATVERTLRSLLRRVRRALDTGTRTRSRRSQ
jgi:pimeloyl-ACP methyl ester carboxylesterase